MEITMGAERTVTLGGPFKRCPKEWSEKERSCPPPLNRLRQDGSERPREDSEDQGSRDQHRVSEPGRKAPEVDDRIRQPVTGTKKEDRTK